MKKEHLRTPYPLSQFPPPPFARATDGRTDGIGLIAPL